MSDGFLLAGEFPLDDGLIYLNHAAVGVWPIRTASAVKAFADENLHRGAQRYPEWMKVEQSLRRRLAWLLGDVPLADIGLLKNTSEGLSLVAYGLDWKPGDNIVSSNREFPSNRIVWESLAGQGVELRQVDLSDPDPEAAIIAALDEHTRLLAISSVQYADGLRLDIARLGTACRERGVLFCIDAIQSLGALAFDAAACMADFVVADGHKWMLGPEGVAVFYAREEAREQLELKQFGWHMVERAGDFDAEDWKPAASARRFEPGSPNMLGIHALDASLSLMQDVGMDTVEREVLKRASRLIKAVSADDRLELVSSGRSDRMSGIVSFRRRDLDAAGHAALYRDLMSQGVICALRGGAIRFSPHFYTPPAVLESAMAMVEG